MPVHLRAPGAAIAIALAFVSSTSSGQAIPSHAAAERPTMLESYQRARSLIAAAVDAHGGIEALRAASRMRVAQEGYEFHPTQSRRVGPPFDSTLRRVDVMVDLPRSRIVYEQTRGYPGGFHYTNRFVTNGDKHFNVFPRNHNYSTHDWTTSEATVRQPVRDSAVVSPRGARERVTWRAQIPRPDAPPGEWPDSGGLALHDSTKRQCRDRNRSANPSTACGDECSARRVRWRHRGDHRVSRLANDRRRADAIARATDARGIVTSSVRITEVTPAYEIPDSLLAPPSSFTVAPPNPPADPAQELAPGVWSVGGGSKSLVVAFSDHLVVVDAPSNGSSQVIARAPTLAPGKPIRYVIPTHHHDDHFFGVRYHVANGSTIVTTPGNIDYLRRMVATPMSSLMLARNQAPPAANYRVETITGDVRVFRDGTRRLEIHRIPSPHAEDMLIAWLPAEGILFQADLIEAPPTGVALRGANAETTKHLAEVLRSKGWKVAVFAGAHASLSSPAVFDEIVSSPIIPPSD